MIPLAETDWRKHNNTTHSPFPSPFFPVLSVASAEYSHRGFRLVLCHVCVAPLLPCASPLLCRLSALLRICAASDSTATFTSKVQFLSSRNLEKEVARLVAAGAALRSNAVGDERTSGVGGGDSDEKDEAAQEKKDADAAEEEDEEGAEEEAESDDMEEGGDYVDNYGDDDEDGGGDPLDDNGDEGETM